MKVGMIGEVTCVAKPLTIIPMVVTQVQDLIAAGQVRPTDQLIDAQQAGPARNHHRVSWSRSTRVGSLASRRAAIASPMPTPATTIVSPTRTSAPRDGSSSMHVDTVGLVHAMILRHPGAPSAAADPGVLQGH